MSRFLIIEDVRDSADWLADRLRAVWGQDIRVDFAVTLKQARRLLASQAYECVIVDIGLPDGDGTQLLGENHAMQQRTSYIMATIHDDDGHVFAALRQGAHGYLLKDAPAEDIERALRGMREGMPPLSPAIALRMMEFFASQKATLPADILTEREREVLAHIARGRSVQDIADGLSLSAHTVRGYIKDIYRKLEISSRAEASLKASRMGLLDE